jgi:hypothetical protein
MSAPKHYEIFKVEYRDNVAVITLNSPGTGLFFYQ